MDTDQRTLGFDFVGETELCWDFESGLEPATRTCDLFELADGDTVTYWIETGDTAQTSAID